MKTEELLRYEAEYRAMGEAFGTFLLVFDFPKFESRVKKTPSPIKAKRMGATKGCPAIL
jgi:hypothetical protein